MTREEALIDYKRKLLTTDTAVQDTIAQISYNGHTYPGRITRVEGDRGQISLLVALP